MLFDTFYCSFGFEKIANRIVNGLGLVQMFYDNGYICFKSC